MARRLRVLFYREWSTAKCLGSGGPRAVLEAVVRIDFAKITIEHRHDHRDRMVFGIRSKKFCNALRSDQILRSQCPLQFKNIEVLANANVLLNVFWSDFRSSRQDNLQLVQFVDHFSQVVAQILR